MGQKFDKKKLAHLEEGEVAHVVDDFGATCTKTEDLNIEEKVCKSNNTNWSITFEQFLASILTEPALVEHFSEKTNLQASRLFVSRKFPLQVNWGKVILSLGFDKSTKS